MQRSELPPHRSVHGGYLTVKNVPGAPMLSSGVRKGPRDPLSFSLSNGRVPSGYPADIPSASVRKVRPQLQIYTRRNYEALHLSVWLKNIRRRVEMRKRIKNTIDEFASIVARDTRVFIVYRAGLSRIYITRVARVWSASGRCEVNEIFLRLPGYDTGRICGATSNANAWSKRPRVRFIHHAVTIIPF